MLSAKTTWKSQSLSVAKRQGGVWYFVDSTESSLCAHTPQWACSELGLTPMVSEQPGLLMSFGEGEQHGFPSCQASSPTCLFSIGYIRRLDSRHLQAALGARGQLLPSLSLSFPSTKQGAPQQLFLTWQARYPRRVVTQ